MPSTTDTQSTSRSTRHTPSTGGGYSGWEYGCLADYPRSQPAGEDEPSQDIPEELTRDGSGLAWLSSDPKFVFGFTKGEGRERLRFLLTDPDETFASVESSQEVEEGWQKVYFGKDGLYNLKEAVSFHQIEEPKLSQQAIDKWYPEVQQKHTSLPPNPPNLGRLRIAKKNGDIERR